MGGHNLDDECSSCIEGSILERIVIPLPFKKCYLDFYDTYPSLPFSTLAPLPVTSWHQNGRFLLGHALVSGSLHWVSRLKRSKHSQLCRLPCSICPTRGRNLRRVSSSVAAASVSHTAHIDTSVR